jgi:hypothetical protein
VIGREKDKEAAITEQGLAMREKMWLVYEQANPKYLARYLDDTEAEVQSQALKRKVDGAREAQRLTSPRRFGQNLNGVIEPGAVAT